MAVMSFFSGNPVSNPNAVLTTRHYERFIFDTAGIFHDALWSTLRIGLITTIVSLLAMTGSFQSLVRSQR